MPLPSTMTPIGTVTSASDFSSAVFVAIPQGYTDLYLVMFARGTDANTGTNNAILRYNSDSGTNYSYVQLTGNGTTASSTRSSANTKLDVFMPRGNETSNAINIIHIMNYSNSTVYKSTLWRANMVLSSYGTEANAGLWRSTSAITRIDVTGNFKANSMFTLYGIKAA